MPISTDNLHTMLGRVKDAKPNVPMEQARTAINDAIRGCINMRTYWADLGSREIVSVPDVVSVGTVSVATGSRLAIGSGTAWPTSDIVNTVLSNDIQGGGYDRATLADITGVTTNSILLLDQGTPAEESVAVVRIDGNDVTAQFAYAHNATCTVRASSYSGRQLRLGRGAPVFTIRSVPTSTTLELDNAWGAGALTGLSYQILLMYVTIHPQFRRFHSVLDQKSGRPLNFLSISKSLLSQMDPQRSSTGDPRNLVDHIPSASGNMQWEIWPSPTSSRQIDVFFSKQWPELVNPQDIPPPFLEATIFTDLASASVLQKRVGVKDPYFDPKLAANYYQIGKSKYELAVNNDEDRHSMDYQHHLGMISSSHDYNWMQSHCVEALTEGF